MTKSTSKLQRIKLAQTNKFEILSSSFKVYVNELKHIEELEKLKKLQETRLVYLK